MDETFSNLTWRKFSKLGVFDLKQAKSEIPRLYAIFQLKLCLSTKMKPLILGAKITICPWNFRHRPLCNETLSFGSRFRIWNLRKIRLLLKNRSKNKIPHKMLNLSQFLGCFVFAYIFKAKVESFLNFRFWILTQMMMFHYIMNYVWNFIELWLFWLPK